MENIAKQMIDFQRTTFNNAFTTIISVQDHAQKFTSDIISQAPWVTEDGKKFMENIVDNMKKTRDTYKTTVLDGFDKMETLFKS